MKTIILIMAISGLLFLPDVLKSQDRPEMMSRNLAASDHLQDSSELAQDLQKRNEDRMYDVKKERTKTKAKAKESQRVSNEANDAAKESRQAVRAEKKAQKFRKKADKQAQKAEDARKKSDRNESKKPR